MVFLFASLVFDPLDYHHLNFNLPFTSMHKLGELKAIDRTEGEKKLITKWQTNNPPQTKSSQLASETSRFKIPSLQNHNRAHQVGQDQANIYPTWEWR